MEMKNIEPKDRFERIAHRNRDNIEQAFLLDRVGMYNKPFEKSSINEPDPRSDIYISESERFNKDFASYDYERRYKDHQKKKERYQTLQTILFDRERKRWERMDYDYLKNENKLMMNKQRDLIGTKNNPGMAFNPITLQYDNSVQGEILKKRDEEAKYRALMRASNIDKHTNQGYNILTGESRTIMSTRMKNEIDPNVYQKHIDDINEINKGKFNKFNSQSNMYGPNNDQYSYKQSAYPEEYKNNYIPQQNYDQGNIQNYPQQQGIPQGVQQEYPPQQMGQPPVQGQVQGNGMPMSRRTPQQPMMQGVVPPLQGRTPMQNYPPQQQQQGFDPNYPPQQQPQGYDQNYPPQQQGFDPNYPPQQPPQGYEQNYSPQQQGFQQVCSPQQQGFNQNYPPQQQGYDQNQNYQDNNLNRGYPQGNMPMGSPNSQYMQGYQDQQNNYNMNNYNQGMPMQMNNMQ